MRTGRTAAACLVLAAGTVPAIGAIASTSQTTLAELAFMAGCWRGSFVGGSTIIEEFYTAPSENLMVGTTRFSRDGVAVQFEFHHIEASDGAVVLTPYPGGVRSEDGFRLTSVQDRQAIFEAPEHDYPKRIVYQADGDESMTAWIDAGEDDPAPRVWKLRSVSCR